MPECRRGAEQSHTSHGRNQSLVGTLCHSSQGHLTWKMGNVYMRAALHAQAQETCLALVGGRLDEAASVELPLD